jgi:MFS family permease
MQEAHDPYAALRHRDYRCLLGGGILSSIAVAMLSVVAGYEIYERTKSYAALGLVGLVQFAPFLLLALPAGHAADRYSRKGLLLTAQALMTLTALGLAALSFWQGPIALMYVGLLLAGVSRAFNAPARWALVAQVVPLPLLANAVTWNSSGWQLAATVGPTLGGVMIYVAGGAAGAYLLAAACAAAGIALLLGIRPRPVVIQREPVTLQSLLAGIGFVWKTKLILATLTLDLFAVLLGGATALLPAFAKDILIVGPDGPPWLQDPAVRQGLLRAAPSFGAILMAIALAHRPPLQRAGRTLLWSVAGFGAATVVFGLSRNFYLSFAMLAVTGALDNVSVVVRGTLVQVLTPDPLRGRVSAVNTIFVSSSNELGEFESGVTAALVGPVLSVVGGGIGTILVVLAVMLRWPEILRLGPLHRAGVVPAVDAETGAADVEQPAGAAPRPSSGAGVS